MISYSSVNKCCLICVIFFEVWHFESSKYSWSDLEGCLKSLVMSSFNNTDQIFKKISCKNCNAFYKRIRHRTVLRQVWCAEFESPPCLSSFLVFILQNAKNKLAVKIAQRYCNALAIYGRIANLFWMVKNLTWRVSIIQT